MSPYEVIVYNKEVILVQETVMAPSEYAAVLRVGPGVVAEDWKDITVLVRPFGK